MGAASEWKIYAKQNPYAKQSPFTPKSRHRFGQSWCGTIRWQYGAPNLTHSAAARRGPARAVMVRLIQVASYRATSAVSHPHFSSEMVFRSPAFLRVDITTADVENDNTGRIGIPTITVDILGPLASIRWIDVFSVDVEFGAARGGKVTYVGIRPPRRQLAAPTPPSPKLGQGGARPLSAVCLRGRQKVAEAELDAEQAVELMIFALVCSSRRY